MGLFRRRPEERATQTWWNQAGIPGLIAAAAYGGQPNVEQALSNAASWACIDVLQDAMGRTPIDAVRPAGESRFPITPVPQIVANPSALVTPTVWRAQLGFEMVTDGNAFGPISQFSRGLPTRIEWVCSGDVTERKVVGGIAQVKYDNDVHQLYPFGDFFHIPGRMVRGGSPFGLSPALYASKSIQASLEALAYGSKFFSRDGMPSWELESSNPDLTEAQARSWKDRIRTLQLGGDVFVHGVQEKLTAIPSDPSSSKFIDLMHFAVEEACRFWRVPPSMAYAAISGENITYANVSQADLNLLKNTLDGYFVRVEESLSTCLPNPQIIKYNRNAVLRGDVAQRMAIYDRQLRNRTTTVNEVRANEDAPPFDDPEFNEPGIPPWGGVPDPTLVAPAGKDPVIPLGDSN